MKKPYLVQRAEIGRQTKPADDSELVRLSQAVDFDYMGSSEFEFGALAKSFRSFEQKLKATPDQCVVHRFPYLKNLKSQPLFVYGCFTPEELTQYRDWILELKDDKIRCKERLNFVDQFHPSTRRFGPVKTDLWWDIQNDVWFSFNEQFMRNLPRYVAASLKYMNEQKANDA